MPTDIQVDITTAVLDEIALAFHIGGIDWTIKRTDAAGVVQTIGTASPLYVLQEEPSRLERLLAQSAAVLRPRWQGYGRTADASAIRIGDTLLCVADASLSFLVTGLDTTDLLGATVCLLERQPFT